jgi:hypothetical protein
MGELILHKKDPQTNYLNFFQHESYFREDPTTMIVEAKGSVTIPGNHLVGLLLRQINQDTLKSLSQLPANALDALYFCNLSIVTNELEFLENLNALRILMLYFTDINDKSFKHIKSFPKLEKLVIFGNQLSYLGLQAIENLSELQSFILLTDYTENPFGDETLEILGSLKNLKEIYLEYSEITNQGIAHLTSLKELQSLNLTFNLELSDACTESLKEIKSLSELDLSICNITDKAVKNLVQLQNLTFLDLWGSKVNKEAAIWLYERLPNCLQINWKEGYIRREANGETKIISKTAPTPEE